MKKNIRTIVLSMVVLCLCTTFIIGGTFALFSDYDEVDNRLVAGNLDIGLYRVNYVENVLDSEGFLAESDPLDGPEDRINLANNEFQGYLFEAVNAVPESWYEATMEISNQGSTAFNYDVRIIWDTDDATAEQKILASQIYITITSDKIDNETHTHSFYLSECADESNIVPLGYMIADKDAVETFKVTAKFIDHEDNNDAMNVSVDFDIRVSATQRVSK